MNFQNVYFHCLTHSAVAFESKTLKLKLYVNGTVQLLGKKERTLLQSLQGKHIFNMYVY